jgi:hypothetical protein
MLAAHELNSNGRKIMSYMPIATEFTPAMSDADVIIARRYWKFKRHASSLNSGARIIRRVPGNSI